MDKRLQRLVLHEQLSNVQQTIRELDRKHAEEHRRFNHATVQTIEALAAARASEQRIRNSIRALQ